MESGAPEQIFCPGVFLFAKKYTSFDKKSTQAYKKSSNFAIDSVSLSKPSIRHKSKQQIKNTQS